MRTRVDRSWDLDRLFDAWPDRPRVEPMPLDAYRRAGSLYVHFDVPGVDPDSIEVTVDDDVLTVKAERVWAEEEGDELIACERPQGTLERQVPLGDDLDREHLEAHFENGVLTVRMQVKEASKPLKIPITVIESARSVETGPSSAAT